MIYKNGDKVVIESKKTSSNWNDVGGMDCWLGEIMTIKEVKEYFGNYKMFEDEEARNGTGWCWYDDMIDHEATAKLNNPYWYNIQVIADKQREKGLSKYGYGLEENNELNIEESIIYLQEELVDALMYCEHLKSKLRKGDK